MPIVLGLGDDDKISNPLGLSVEGLTGSSAKAPGISAASTPPEKDRSDFDRAVDTVISEAWGEGDEGMAAVAAVIKNRSAERGLSPGQVVTQPDQFSPPSEASLKAMRDPNLRAKAAQILAGVMDGQIPDPTGGADHFHADYVSPDWAQKMRKTSQIGRHLFYSSKEQPETEGERINVDSAFAPKDGLGLNGGENPFDAVLTEKADEGKSGSLSFVHKGQEAIAPELRGVLDGASADLGRPLTITSGYRPASHPVEAAKKEPGQHTHRLAADIDMSGMDEAQRAGLVQTLIARGGKRFITYSHEPNMLHVDLKDQTGDGKPYFMFDTSARNMARAPGWFKSIAQADYQAGSYASAYAEGQKASRPAKSEQIEVGADFQFSNPLGLELGETQQAVQAGGPSSLPDPKQEAVQDLIERENLAADRAQQQLEQESPGRYAVVPESDAGDFQRQWETDNRSSGVMGDTARHLDAGAADLALSIDELIRKVPKIGEPIADGMAAINGWLTGKPFKQNMQETALRDRVSTTAEDQAAMQKQAFDKNAPFYVGDALKDPRWYIGQVSESAPSMAATMLPGGVLARASYAKAIAAGMTPAQAAARAARTATISGALGEGAITGAQSSLAVKERIKQLPRDTLLKSDAVQSLISQGMSEDEAISAVTEDSATQAFIFGGVAAGMFGGIGDRVLARIVAEGVGGSTVRRMVTGGAREFGAEAIEEAGQNAGQTIAENKAVQNVDPTQSATEGLGESVVSGAAVGGVMGGTMGGIAGAARPRHAEAQPESSTLISEGDTPPVTPPVKKGGLAEALDVGKKAAEQAATRIAGPSQAPQGMPPAGATVLISEDGTEFMGTIDSWDNGEAVVLDSQTGEFLQVPASSIKQVMHQPSEPTPGETKSVLPPIDELKKADSTIAGPPDAGKRVVVQSEGVEPFAAKIEGYTGNDAVVKTDDGRTLQVPISDLAVSGLSEKQVEAEDLKRNPPEEREPAEKTETSRTIFGKTVDFPDDRHARMFDLALERLQSKKLLGGGAMDMDKVMPAEQAKLAREFGVSPEALGQMADDYRFRAERMAKSAKSSLPQKMHPVNEQLLKRMQAESAKKAQASLPVSEEAPAQTVLEKSGIVQAGEIDEKTSQIDQAAHEAAQSPHNDLPEPSDAQKEAGNYKKGHVRIGGLDIAIENPQGSVRRGKSGSGKAWETEMKSHYGYIKGTVGRDKDHIDVFVRPGTAEIGDDAPVFVVDQRDPARGRFDEHKVMLGWDNQKQARDAYLENYSKGWKGLGAITATTLGEFKNWLKEGDTKTAFGPKWFAAKNKAEEYLRKEKLEGSYEVVPNGLRFEIQKKTPVTNSPAQTLETAGDGKPASSDKKQSKADIIAPPADKPGPTFNDLYAKDEQAIEAAVKEHARVNTTEKAIAKAIADGADNKTLIEEFTKHVAGTSGPGYFIESKGKAAAHVKLYKPDGTRQVTLRGKELADTLRSLYSEAGAKALPNATAPEHVSTGVDDRELSQIVREFGKAADTTVQDGEAISHIFDAPKKSEIVRLADKVKVYHRDHGWMSPDEARAQIQKWKDDAKAQGEDAAIRSVNSRKVVLSLFDLSGEWSKPWEEAGYQVYRFDIQDDPDVGDVNNFSTQFFGDWFGDFDGEDIHAILAACPCTDFAVSGARHFAAKDKDGRTVASVKLVHQTLATIEYFKPAVWAIENPVGRIEDLGGLPPWRLSFDPNHLGETYTKKTLIWGRFNADLPIAPVEPVEGSKMHKQFGGKSLKTKNARSVTPEGFSYAFFKANNFHEHTAMALANKFDRLDPKLIREAVDKGIAIEDIEEAVADPYYIELDDDAANQALKDLINPPTPPKQAKPVKTPEEAQQIAESAKPEPKPAVDQQFGDNKIFTADKVAAARARMKAKMSQLNAGLDPELLIDGMTIAGAYVESGIRDFAKYASMMVDDFGPSIQPYLLSFWEGVRNYPGLDTKGMTSPDEARTLHENMNSEIPASEAVAVGNRDIAPAPRTKKTGKPGDITLTDDWGTDHIDAYTDDGEETKKAFLKESEKYLKIVQSELMDRGYLPHDDKKGRAMKPVSSNPGGIAVSGDVSLTLRSPDGSNLYVHIGQGALRGTVPTTKSGVHVMYRSSLTQGDQFATKGDSGNQWAKPDMTASAFADMLDSHIKKFETQWARTKTDGVRKLENAGAGTLERVPAEPVQGTAENRNAGTSVGKRGGADGAGTEAIGGKRDSARRSIPDGQGKLSLPAGGSEPTAAGTQSRSGDGQGRDERKPDDGSLEQGPFGPILRGYEGKWREAIEALTRMKTGEAIAALSHRDVGPIDLVWGKAGTGKSDGFGLAKLIKFHPEVLDDLQAFLNRLSIDTSTSTQTRIRLRDETGLASIKLEFDGKQKTWLLTAYESAGNDARTDTAASKSKDDTASLGTGTGRNITKKSEKVDTAAVVAANRPSNYEIKETDNIGSGGQKTKFRDNVNAIRILRRLDDEKSVATAEEQSQLARWVGWGGLQQAFYREDGSTASGWDKEAKELKELLTADEYRAAESSTRNAHYTSPEIVKGIWDAVGRMGFTGGQVLEPSVGAGNFLGLMPAKFWDGSKITGVELDHITGAIAKNLYPNANIQAPVGFQSFTVPDGYFDLAVGNPPFGSEKLNDKQRRSISKFSIHNFFFAKSIDGLRPGGVLAMVITNRFLDANNAAAREYIASKADLIGAIRLPNNAFLKNAGTEVTTDIVFLRKRIEGEPAQSTSWTQIEQFKDKNGKSVPLNRYFIENPEMMLGEFGAFGTMYGPDEPALIARPGADIAAELQKAITALPENIMPVPGVELRTEEPGAVSGVEDAVVGSMFLSPDGTVNIRDRDALGEAQSRAVDLSDTAKERVSGMIRIRDVFAKLRRAQISENATDAQIDALRASLNKFYDAFVKKHGPINAYVNWRLFRDDPTWPQLAALEDSFDKGVSATVAKSTGEPQRPPSAKKAAIFSKRTQQPYRRPDRAKTAKDALAQSLGELGRVDIDHIAKLYGKTKDDVVKELGPLLFKTPSGAYETADQYLSGNVKKKLAEARAAVGEDPSLARNIEELERVIPADIDAVDIDVKPGVPWIPEKHIIGFMQHITEGKGGKAYYSRGNAKWVVEAPAHSPAADVQWSTPRTRIAQILDAAINGSNITVYDRTADGKAEVNREETDAANEKVAKVRDEWRRWLWTDDARREELARIYNDVYNTDVQRVYDGAHLTFPGKVSDDIISLRPHQKSFVWRVLQSGTTLADHTVGAGKTFALIASAMELRRTGLAKKPIFVVPNHLVGQWGADFIKLYPGAKVLAATEKDFEKENRKKLFARISTGDWDAVIVAHSSFGKIGVAPEIEAKFIQDQIADIEDSERDLRAATGEKSRNAKQLSKRRETLQTRLQKLLDGGRKDEGLTFDELGIDAIFVDEAHEFKNLGFVTSMNRVAGLGNQLGSQKAADLYMKVQLVKQRTGGRNIVFATGTPVSNTMAEMYTVQRYLDYEGLQNLGITHFDAWAKVFGEVVTDWELSPSGQYKLNSRFSKFVNMPELIQRYRSFADVITNDDIKAQLARIGKTLPLPKVKGGKPQNIVVEPSTDQRSYIGEGRLDPATGEMVFPEGTLVYRSEHLPKKAEKGSDNMLKIMSDARKAALDMRLIDPSYPDYPGSKIHIAARNIKRLYDAWHEKRGTQLVFIDLSTPKKAAAKEAARLRDLIAKAEAGDESAQETLDKMSPDEFMALDSSFSVYDDLKEKLIQSGIPEAEIAFIHDANTDAQKEELFGKVRSGRVRILFGSTPKMGAGTNVQNRLVALHHLDAPWRPSDLEQRDGRGIRQGNELYNADPENFEIEILRYAVEKTLDARQWQTIEQKATFIQQIRKGGSKERVIEDIGGEAANAAEMKAAASGNPLILEEMETKRKLRKLEDQAREHDREQHRVRALIRQTNANIAANESLLPAAAADAKRAADNMPEQFSAKFEGKSFDKPKEFGEAVVAKIRAMLGGTKDEQVNAGSYGGFDIIVETVTRRGQVDAVLTIKGDDEYQIDIGDPMKIDATGLAMRIRNTVARIPDRPEVLQGNIDAARAQLPKLEKQIAEWPHQDELTKTAARHRELIETLRPKKQASNAPIENPDLPSAPVGWENAETENDNTFTEADYKKVEEIITQVSGLPKTQWAERIGFSKGANLWGADEGFHPAGVYNTVQDAIAISREHAYPSVAYHESFHRIQNLFLSKDERAVLRAERGRLKRIVLQARDKSTVDTMHQVEIEAEAFAVWSTNKDLKIKPHKTIRALWGKIAELTRRVQNYLAGRGFQTASDIFEKAKSGEMTTRSKNPDPALQVGKFYQIAPKPTEFLTEKRIVNEVNGKLTDLQPKLLKAVPLNYFGELKRPNMTAVDDYLRVKRMMDAYRGKKHGESDEIAQEWLKYTRIGFMGKDRAAAQRLADLMHQSTLAAVDPSLTTDEEKAKPGYADLRKAYLAMAPKGREIYGKVRDAYKEQAEEVDRILLDNVRKSMQIAADQAEARFLKEKARIEHSNLSPAKKKQALDEAAATYKAQAKRAQWTMKARMTQLRIAFENSRVPAPYFPLGRFGRYFVSVSDVNGEILSFSKHEAAADRNRVAAQMRKEFPAAKVTAGVLDNKSETREAMDPRIIAEIETILGDAGVNADVQDAIWQRYLESMPDLSTRKRFIHRKGIAGFNQDALRVFASHMFHAAHQMARLKYGMELGELVSNAKDQAQESDDQTRGMTLANELAGRHEWVMNPTGRKVAQYMTSAAFVWMMAASPAAAITNLTQTVMMGVPILGGRFGGLTKASSALLKASGDFIMGKGSAAQANLTDDEKRALEAFYDSGLIDRTHSHDMAGVGDTGVDYSPMKSKIMAIISWAFHKAEVANREITALAAYRLARAHGLNASDAIDEAHNLTWKTHFDYSNSSRPALMQNDVAKVMLVFRNYSINMNYRIFRDIHQMVKGETQQARREAKYQLAGVLGMQALMAGVSGVAGFNLAMALAGIVFGDDDDPMDFETRFRANVIDILGPELGGIVLNGVPGHYAGISLTDRIGMPDLWFRSPARELQGKAEYQYWLSQIFGASFSVGEKMYMGFSVAKDGDVARGIEIAAPKAIGDLMKAYRYYNEGLTNTRGDQILPQDAVTLHDVVVQGLGFAPARVSEAWDRKTALENAEGAVQNTRQKLINRFAAAVIMKDADAKADALADIKAFNAVPVNRAMPITRDSLRSSLQTRARNASKREDGALIENRALGKKLRAELPDRIY